jgi:hypothetical protein
LFYHSLEVAMLAGRTARDEGEHEAIVMASYLAGLLHDLGKVRSLFIVSKYEPSQATMEFGETQQEPLVWSPDDMNLADWCAVNDVRYLGLKYRSDNLVGHSMYTRKQWRRVVSEDLLAHIASLPDGERAVTLLVNTLDLKNFDYTLHARVQLADHASIARDAAPAVRWAPKRSDLHLIRRFYEFAALSPWNVSEAPFLYADVLINGVPTGQTLPFLVSSGECVGQFRAYLMSEDLYGHCWPDNFYSYTLDTLEKFGLVRADLPFDLPALLDDQKFGWGPTRRARLRYLEGARNQELPLVYCPLAQADVRPGLPNAVVDLPGPLKGKRRWIWNETYW